MNSFSPFSQLQSWPTPEMFINRREFDLIDRCQPAIALDSLLFVMPLPRDIGTEGGGAFIGMDAFVVNGPQNRGVSDDETSRVLLDSFVAVLPQNRPVSDTGGSAVLLDSFVAVLPQNRPVSETPGAGVALDSFAV